MDKRTAIVVTFQFLAALFSEIIIIYILLKKVGENWKVTTNATDFVVED
jgi:hypothetical protein